MPRIFEDPRHLGLGEGVYAADLRGWGIVGGLGLVVVRLDLLGDCFQFLKDEGVMRRNPC